MSLVDPGCHPQLHADDRQICAGCFADADLQDLVRSSGSWSSCDFCGSRRAKTVELSRVTEHICERVNAFYGRAVDQVPYESAEGGYLADNFDSYDLLVDRIGIDLPRDHGGGLLRALVDALGDEQWCAYEWTRLELDESLASSWRRFTETVKHRRRYFFHGKDFDDTDPGDDRSPIQFFRELGWLLTNLARVRRYPAGLALYRARPRQRGERHTTPASLGPPPAAAAVQSNCMNPPGIPIFYGAESERLAIAEVRNGWVSLGRFETTRDIRIIDLVDLPAVPGFFSQATRPRRQHLSFLHDFAREVSLPVPRDDRVHVEYVPTQVFTEFLRDELFDGERVDGIRYPTATGGRGSNIVLFAEQRDVEGAVPVDPFDWFPLKPWLRLARVVQKRGVRKV